MQIKIVNKSKNPLPAYATMASSGMDIRACLESPIVIKSMQRELIPTGLFVEIPIGFEAQIRPRSGLAIKNGISVLNSPGTIDADYRGEIKIVLVNLSNENFTVNNGDRIAQMIIASHERAAWKEVETLETTQRGSGGFGHTGTN